LPASALRDAATGSSGVSTWGEVHQGGGAAGEDEGEAVGAHQAIVSGLDARAGGQLRAGGLARLVDALEHHHLRAVDRTVGMLAAREAGLEGERRVSGRVHEARGREPHVAVAGGEIERAYAGPVARHGAQDRAEQHGDLGLAHGLLDPARQRDLVVHHHSRIRRAAAAVMQRALRAEFAQDVVGDAVGELIAVRAVGEQPAERADDRIDGLAAQRRKCVDEGDLAAETGRFECRGDAGDAGAQHADIGGHVPRGCARCTPHDPGRRRDLCLVRAHHLRLPCR
jgi:hypothetical protein